MSTDRDTTRIVRSWLKRDGRESAERVLDSVLDQIDTIPQRRPGWAARRFPEMSISAKIAMAAAAAVVIAILGFQALFTGPRVGGPGPTPSPTLTPTPTPAPTPQPLPVTGALEPGTYAITDPKLTPRSFTLTVPAGWSTDEDFVTKGNTKKVAWSRDVYVTTWIVTHVFNNACLPSGNAADSLVETRSPIELAAALVRQGGHETRGDDPATLGGYPARRLQLSVPVDFDMAACNGALLRLWPDAGPDLSGGLPIAPGQTMSIYVVDIDGHAVVIIAASRATTTASDKGEMDRVLASIRFAASVSP